jgi:hypothetical protein
MRLQLVCFALSAAAAACSPFNPDLGDVPYLCGTEEPQCPEGYTCTENGGRMVCLSPEGMLPIDAAVPTFVCADDGQLNGPSGNDTIQTAYVLPSNLPTITLGPLSICPEGDLDHYMVQVPAMGNLEAVVTWESGAPISVRILGSGGATLNNGVGNGERSTRAYVANLPAGAYFVRVSADPSVKNNYKLTVKVD